MTTHTIVATATPPGEGGVAILRLSGPEADAVLARVFVGRVASDRMQPRRLYLGNLLDASGTPVDEVLAVRMPGPHSYTGEDLVEFHCHGGNHIRRVVLDLLIDAGARLAAPGEFTQRAFLNGRLDLAQAEAVIDLIRARSDQASRLALGQLGGRLSNEIHALAAELKTVLALLEAYIDFPDDEVGQIDRKSVDDQTRAVYNRMRRLTESFDTARLLRDGINLLIIGRPNVGKSSLMNALLGESRAIVTEVAGTTRDTLEEQMVLGSMPVRLIDTAGVRDSQDPIEAEGVRRARAKAETADLALLVIDGSQPLCAEDQLAAQLCDPGRTLLVINKADLPSRIDLAPFAAYTKRVQVSAKQGDGLAKLVDAVAEHFSVAPSSGDVAEDVVITERRHREALILALGALERFLSVLPDPELPLECLAIELHEALAGLGQITGETTPDEILDQIFSRFCIGK